MGLGQHVGLFLIGLVVLVLGAEGFIRGAVRVARWLGVSPFLIGLTLVGFGTSAPELVVNLSAALANAPGIAVGNVVGSNVANVGLILGAAALVRPLDGQMRMLKAEIPIMLAASVLLLVLCRDGTIGRIDAAVLLVGFAGVMAYMVRSAGAEPPAVKEEVGQLTARTAARPWLAGVLIAGGLAGLLGGAHLMVEAAVAIARGFGVSDLTIGLTVVAVGTSLPELASSVAAAVRKESDIAIGNVVGSNIFNVLLILGATAAVIPLPVEESAVRFDLPVMILFSAALVPVLLNGLKVHRWEGGLLLAAYAGFLAWQVVR